VIQAIHAEARSARIYIGLYPVPFGKSKSNYSEPLFAPGTLACEVGLNLWIGYKDALWLDKLGKELNTDISDAAKTAKGEGVDVTPVTPSFASHGFCDGSEPWLYPIELEPKLGIPPVAATVGSFHPTELGQRSGYEAAFAATIK
jgi:hypothetical protein